MMDDHDSTTSPQESPRSWSMQTRRGLSAFVSLAICLLVSMLLGTSCSKSKVAREHLGIDMDSAYMMLTRDVDMLVSDSGQTRYRMTAPVWIIYDRPDRKEWLFPESLRMRSVDSLNPGNELVWADTAHYYVDRDEWYLVGNVRIHGLKGERLYSKSLHWLRKERRLYSNDSTYFYADGNEQRGTRFEAADNLSWYSVYNISGDLRIKDEPPTGAPDSTASSTPRPTAP